MANRLTRIYTRTGDAGDTGTADGARIAKDDVLIHVQGELDELNSWLGLLASGLANNAHIEIVRGIQNKLFDLGGELSLGQAVITPCDVTTLEWQLDSFNATLEPLKEFILPGGAEPGSICHLARAVCRRVERSMVSLGRERDINKTSLAFINRLSDLLFVFARVLNGGQEIYWNTDRVNNEK
jgi:cob(I)alamin adenosyltransferase